MHQTDVANLSKSHTNENREPNECNPNNRWFQYPTSFKSSEHKI